MTILEAFAIHKGSQHTLLDLEGQTTLLSGAELPVRVVFDSETRDIGLSIAFRSGTAPTLTLWDPVEYHPLNLGRVWRRDQNFAHGLHPSVWGAFLRLEPARRG